MSRSRRIAMIPAYNEEQTIVQTLDEVASHVDMVVLINDGSTDTSRLRILQWPSFPTPTYLLDFQTNQGKARALKCGFRFLSCLHHQGLVCSEDIVVFLDADGQHDIRHMDTVCALMCEQEYDVMIARRDLSQYPLTKRLGNQTMSLFTSCLTGHRYHDVECGYRFVRLGVVLDLAKYYVGYGYSCEQEIAVLAACLGYRVCDDFPVAIRYYRSNTRVRDVFINSFCALLAWMRCQYQRGSVTSQVEQVLLGSRTSAPVLPHFLTDEERLHVIPVLA